MSQVTSTFVDTSRRNRSAITNGSWLLEGVDNRTSTGRRYRDLCLSFADDLGGASNLSETQRAMVRQAAAVTVEAERMQADIVRGEKIDHEQMVRVSNTLARLMKSLDTKAGTGPKPMQLAEYLKARAVA